MLTLLFYAFVLNFLILVETQKVEEVLSKFHQHDYKLRFERSILVNYDTDYYNKYVIKTFKYNRTQAVCNITYEFRVDVGYDLEVLVQVYKRYGNEYRNFPIRMQVNFCSVVEADVGGFGRSFKNKNSGCPLKKNVAYHLDNFYPDEVLFPPLMPTGEFMGELTAFYKNKNISIMQSYVTIYRTIKIE